METFIPESADLLFCGLIYYDSRHCDFCQIESRRFAGQLDSVYRYTLLGAGNGQSNDFISLRSGFDSSFDFAETISVEVAAANSSWHCIRLFYDILQLPDDLCTDCSQLCPSDWHVSGQHCSGCNRNFLLYAGKYHAAGWGRCYAGSFRGDEDCLSESQGCI